MPRRLRTLRPRLIHRLRLNRGLAGACLALCLSAALPTLASAAAVRADFNGDGRSDLAVGVPGEDVGSIQSAGVVNIIYGSATGLKTTGGTEISEAGAGGKAEDYDFFGSALAVGDLNGDGKWDLAVGAPGQDFKKMPDVGVVRFLYGSATGLKKAAVGQRGGTFQDNGGGTLEPGDRYGAALVVSDFDANKTQDLAVGAPGEDATSSKQDVGVVNVLYRDADGKIVRGKQFNQGQAGGKMEASDIFGHSLAAGNFDNVHGRDLAVGAPGEDLGPHNVGVVNTLYAAAGPDSGLKNPGKELSETDWYLPLNKGDQFGSTLAAANFDGKGGADLAIGMPFYDFQAHADGGVVLLAYAGATGAPLAPLDDFNQFSAKGYPDAGDRFGAALAAGYFNSDAGADLAVGVPLEDVGQNPNAGVVDVFYNAASTAGRLSAEGAREFTQKAAGGQVEPNDGFGNALSAANFNGKGNEDLAVGASGEKMSSYERAGAINVLYSYPFGKNLNSSGAHQLAQDLAGGMIEPNDGFGFELP